MAKILNLGCIACENRGCVSTTKNGYRCSECGHVWQKDGKKKSSSKSASAKKKG